MKILLTLFALLFSISCAFAQQDSLIKKLETAQQSQKAKILNELAVSYQNLNWDSSHYYAAKALEEGKNYQNSKQTSRAYALVAKTLLYEGHHNLAEQYLDSATIICQNNYPETYIEVLSTRAMIKEQHGAYAIALELHQKALEIAVKINSDNAQAKVYNNLGIVYKEIGEYEKSLEFFKKSLAIKKKQKDIYSQAFLTNNIGIIYDLKHDIKNALQYYMKALELNKQLNNDFAAAYIKHNIAIIWKKQEKYRLAKKYLQEALQTAETFKDHISIVYNHYHMGDLYFQTGKYNKAVSNVKKSLKLAEKQDLGKAKFKNYKLLSDIYNALGKRTEALHFYKEYAEIKDSIFNEESSKRIEELQAAYEKDRMQKRLKILEKEQALNTLKLEKSEAKLENRNLWLAIILGGFLLILAFTVILMRQIQQKKKVNYKLMLSNKEINQQNEEIKVQRDYLSELNNKLEAQNNEIETQNNALAEQNQLATAQRDKIFEQKKWLTDNITYASRIQQALLPPIQNFEYALSDFFIFNRPQGIVGGDFYWIYNNKTTTIIATADCTGHGVTGGFMSILGISLLNDIVTKRNISTPARILDETRNQLIDALHQTDQEDENKDGMDITIIKLNKQDKTYEFAAANQKAYKIDRNSKEIKELIGDNMPVSMHDTVSKNFTGQSGIYTENDTFYLFSDGFPDQFGGKNDKKYLHKRFRQLITENAHLSMAQQLDKVAEEFYQWKGPRDQVDDVLVVGLIP